jgi:hypothetical protein
VQEKEEVIGTFDGQYRFLSNFYPASVILDGKEYPSTEHAFQAAKFSRTAPIRERIRKTRSARTAKRLGHTPGMFMTQRAWRDYRSLTIMRDVVWQKFTRHEELKRLLLATGEKRLEEGNTWHDNTWGICHCKGCKALRERGYPYSMGRNQLGKILMQVRAWILDNQESAL